MNRGDKLPNRFPKGSALILTVMLSTILAIVAVMFLLASRVESLSTSSLIDAQDLNNAVDTVVAKISNELVLDTPGIADQEYYDYPGDNDKWLASLEPYYEYDPNKSFEESFYWEQISDLTGYIRNNFGINKVVQDVNVAPTNLPTTTRVREYSEIVLDNNGKLEETSADADGDGIADSKWFELEDASGSKGQKFYAAVRIIDNGGMLNINTAYMPNMSDANRCNGSRLNQINLDTPVGRSGSTANDIFRARADMDVNPTDPNLEAYERYGAMRISDPCEKYTLFDISDELELRHRFLVSSPAITRIETVWSDTVGEDWDNIAKHPFNSFTDYNLIDWTKRFNNPTDPNETHDRRHLLTTYNIDRIVAPDGEKMVNVNRIDDANSLSLLYSALRRALDPNIADTNSIAAQTAVNLKDYVDADPDITTFTPDVNGVTYYGFERPCIYVSELAWHFKQDPNDPNIVYRSYAVELYKPYTEDTEPNQWRLKTSSGTVPINWAGSGSFHVIRWQDPCVPLTIDPNFTGTLLEPNYVPQSVIFDANSFVSLERFVDINKPNPYLVVDSVHAPGSSILIPEIISQPRSIQRDIKQHRCIMRLWDSNTLSPTLGSDNEYNSSNTNYIQAHPANTDFTNIGEIGTIFRKAAYYEADSNNTGVIGYSDDDRKEANVRLNLADSRFQPVMEYLTVFDPTTINNSLK
ncbi:MAG: hypothetical protein WC962_10665, partial [Phycisphaerae bacterium]